MLPQLGSIRVPVPSELQQKLPIVAPMRHMKRSSISFAALRQRRVLQRVTMGLQFRSRPKDKPGLFGAKHFVRAYAFNTYCNTSIGDFYLFA